MRNRNEILIEFGKFIYDSTIDKKIPLARDNIEELLETWLSLSYIKDWSKVNNELSREVYELSKSNNSIDDIMFFVVEEFGEVLTSISHLRRDRNTKDSIAREGIQAIIQIEQLAHHLGVLDEMWDLYDAELRVLQHKIEARRFRILDNP